MGIQKLERMRPDLEVWVREYELAEAQDWYARPYKAPAAFLKPDTSRVSDAPANQVPYDNQSISSNDSGLVSAVDLLRSKGRVSMGEMDHFGMLYSDPEVRRYMAWLDMTYYSVPKGMIDAMMQSYDDFLSEQSVRLLVLI